jgi:hypothetical protein
MLKSDRATIGQDFLNENVLFITISGRRKSISHAGRRGFDPLPLQGAYLIDVESACGTRTVLELTPVSRSCSDIDVLPGG